MKCFNCGNENKENIINCEYCGKELPKIENFNDIKNNIKIRNMTIKDHIIIVTILLVPVIILISSVYFMFNFKTLIGVEKEKPANAEQTKGYLNSFEECSYDKEEYKEFCKAVYKYEVDGIEYYIKTDFSSPKEDHNKENIIHYNRDNPTDSSIEIIESNFSSSIQNTIAIGFMFFAAIILVIIIMITIIFVKCEKEQNKIKKNRIN